MFSLLIGNHCLRFLLLGSGLQGPSCHFSSLCLMKGISLFSCSWAFMKCWGCCKSTEWFDVLWLEYKAQITQPVSQCLELGMGRSQDGYVGPVAYVTALLADFMFPGSLYSSNTNGSSGNFTKKQVPWVQIAYMSQGMNSNNTCVLQELVQPNEDSNFSQAHPGSKLSTNGLLIPPLP